MGGMGRHLVGALVAVAIALLVAQTLHAAVDPGVTLEGTLSGGGTVRITLTSDRSAVIRAELSNATFQYFTPGGTQTSSYSRTLYYHPPQALADGHLQIGLPNELFGQARSSVSLKGDLTDPDHLAGTATLVACVFPVPCFNLGTVSWSAAGPTDTPPAPSDERLKGDFLSGGAITLARNAQGGVTSFELDGLSVDPCIASLDPLSMRFFFDSAFGDSVSVLVSTPKGLHSLAIEITAQDGQTTSGNVLFGGYYGGDCVTNTAWTAGVNQPPTLGGVAEYPREPASSVGLLWPSLAIAAFALAALGGGAIALGRRTA